MMETGNKGVIAVLALLGLGGGYYLYNKNKVAAKPQTVPPNGMTFDPGMDADTQTAINNALMKETNPTNLRQLAIGARSKGFTKAAAALDAKAAAIEAMNSPQPGISPIGTTTDSNTTPKSPQDVPAALDTLTNIAATTAATPIGGNTGTPSIAVMDTAALVADKALEAPMTILQVQKALNLLMPEAKLVEDGVNGTKTTNAIKSFQAHAYLSVDGIPGPQTWKAIRKALAAQNLFVG